MTQAVQKRSLPSIESVFEQLNWRYATKGFDPERKLTDRDWETIRDAAILAPSSYGLQPFKMIVVTDQDMKEKLRPACFDQPQIEDCSHLVIFAARKDFTEKHVDEFIGLVSEVREAPEGSLDEFRGILMGLQGKLEENGAALDWAKRQVYISLGFMLYTAAITGIDACPMEGFQADKVDKILGLEGYTSTVICALGHRTSDDWLVDMKKVRFPAERLVHHI